MKLIVTIDTEEDNWGSYHPKEYSLQSIERIPELQGLFDEYGIIPTYLITYSVATDPRAVSILKKIVERGRCEIGTHCHPWNTPPFDDVGTERNSMLCNLPGDLQFRKIECLHQAIVNHFNIVPVSFRAGRWGYGREVATALDKFGYKVDSSILSFYDWTDQFGPNFSKISPEPYRFDPEHHLVPAPAGRIVEVPATIAYLQTDFGLSNTVFNLLRKKPLNRLRLIGILDRLGLLNKIWLSPEQASAGEMIALMKTLIRKRFPVANLFFHSPTLEPGWTPYVKTEEDRRAFMNRIREVLRFAKENGIEPISLSESAKVAP